jgi:hypothetical protein
MVMLVIPHINNLSVGNWRMNGFVVQWATFRFDVNGVKLGIYIVLFIIFL